MNGTSDERVLVVMSDADAAARIATALTRAGYAVTVKGDSLDGLIAVEDEHPALVVLDWGMPFIDGAIFLHALRAGLERPPPVLVLAGPDVDPDAVRATGARDCLPITSTPEQVVSAAHAILAPG